MFEPGRVLFRSVVRVLFLLIACFSTVSKSEVIYDNTSRFLGQSFNERREFGDQVDLEGTARNITQILFETYGDFTPTGDEGVRVRIYTNEERYDNFRRKPTTLLFESPLLGIENGFRTMAVTGLNLPVPFHTITVTFEFVGVSAEESAGVLFYDPPRAGYSFNEVWRRGQTGLWVPILYSTTDPMKRANIGMRIIADANIVADQVQTTSVRTLSLWNGGNEQRYAQTFTPAVSGFLNHIVVSSEFTNTVPMAVRILDTAGEEPGPNVLGTRFVVRGTGMQSLNFSEDKIYLEAGNLYAIELSTTAETSSFAYDYNIAVGDDVYDRGELWQRDEMAGAWSRSASIVTQGGFDMVFEAHLIPAAPAVQLTSPRPRQNFDLTEPILLSAQVELPDAGTAVLVRYLSGAQEIGVVTNAPFELTWRNASPGEHAIRAIAEDRFRRPFRSEQALIQVSPAGPPGNDLFARRLALHGGVARSVKPAALATLEPGEPRAAAGYSGKTLWWMWTAPDDRPVTISARNSTARDASVGIFIGRELQSLTRVTSGIGEARFIPETGRTYSIAVEPRVTTEFMTLDIVSADVGLEISSNVVRATEPYAVRVSGSEARVITNVVVGLQATGGGLGSEIFGRTNKAPAVITNRLETSGTFELVAVAVDSRGVRTVSRPIEVTVRPANDLLRHATVLEGFSVETEFSSVAATREFLDPLTYGDFTRSIWFKWTAPADGMVRMETFGRTNRSIIGVFRALNTAATSFETPPHARVDNMPRAEFYTRAGETYVIELVADHEERGRLHLSLTPANDLFARRGFLEGYEASERFWLTEGGIEPGEPEFTENNLTNDSSLWWSWTAPTSGNALVEARPAGLVEVFTGETVAELTSRARGMNRCTFSAMAGRTYHIRVAGSAAGTNEGSIEIILRALQLTQPMNNQVFEAPATVALSARGMGGPVGELVEFLINGSVVGEGFSSGEALIVSNLNAATYEVSARSKQIPSRQAQPVFIHVKTNRVAYAARLFAGPYSRASVVVNPSGIVSIFGSRPAELGEATHPDAFHPAVLTDPTAREEWREIASSFAHFYLDGGGLLASNTTLIPERRGGGPWKRVAAGSNAFVALTEAGHAYRNGTILLEMPAGVEAWSDVKLSNHGIVGLSSNGELFLIEAGTGALKRSIARPEGVERWVKIDSSQNSGLGLGSNGEIYSLNLAAAGTSITPTLVTKPAGVQAWRTFAAGGNHQLLLAENGTLYAMGRNVEGQLGLGRASSVEVLQRLQNPAGVSGWSDIAAGELHSMAIADNCALYVWGSNSHGQLGLGRHLNFVARPTVLERAGGFCLPPVEIVHTRNEDGSNELRFGTFFNRRDFVEYSDDLTTWLRSPVVFEADGSEVSWIDAGPPETVSDPSGEQARYYRVVRE